MLCVPLTPIGQVQAVKAVGRGAIRKDDLVREIMADFGDTNHRNPMYRAPRTRRWRPLPPPPPSCIEPFRLAEQRSCRIKFMHTLCR